MNSQGYGRIAGVLLVQSRLYDHLSCVSRHPTSHIARRWPVSHPTQLSVYEDPVTSSLNVRLDLVTRQECC